MLSSRPVAWHSPPALFVGDGGPVFAPSPVPCSVASAPRAAADPALAFGGELARAPSAAAAAHAARGPGAVAAVVAGAGVAVAAVVAAGVAAAAAVGSVPAVVSSTACTPLVPACFLGVTSPMSAMGCDGTSSTRAPCCAPSVARSKADGVDAMTPPTAPSIVSSCLSVLLFI